MGSAEHKEYFLKTIKYKKRQRRKKPNNMINGFEKETHPLREREITVYMPIIAKAILDARPKAIRSTDLQDLLIQKVNTSVHGSRIRAIINFLRKMGTNWSKGDVLVATSKGYKLTSNAEEILKYQGSLAQRINEIQRIKDCIDTQAELLRSEANHVIDLT